METTIHLPSNLKHMRSRRGVSQDVVATALDIKRSSYIGYENGTAEPALGLLVRMSRYYRVPLDQLLTEDLSAMPESKMGIMERTFNHTST